MRRNIFYLRTRSVLRMDCNAQYRPLKGMTERTNLGRQSLLVVDNDTPAKVELLVLDLHETSRLEEWKAVVGVGHDLPEISRHLVKLLTILVVTRDELLVGDSDRSLLCFLLLKFYTQPVSLSVTIQAVHAHCLR